LPNFGEVPDGEDEGGSMPAAKAIFSVLSTDTTASNYFNGAADRQALIAEASYAQAITSHAPGMDSYSSQLHDAMTLRGLVNSGIHMATQGDVENQHITQEEAQHTEYNRRKTAYEVGSKIITSGVGFIPGAGAAASAILGIMSTALEGDIIGQDPTDQPLIYQPLPDMSIGQADREILNAIIASGKHVEGVSDYLVDGRIGTPAELAKVGKTFTIGAYDQAINQALTNLYAQNYKDGVGRPLIPDRDMIGRYNAIIKDLHGGH
jgi:hypothetical protein